MIGSAVEMYIFLIVLTYCKLLIQNLVRELFQSYITFLILIVCSLWYWQNHVLYMASECNDGVVNRKCSSYHHSWHLYTLHQNHYISL